MNRTAYYPVKRDRPLTPERALDIFLCELPVPQIMALYGVGKSVVYDIKAGRTWSHVTGKDGRRDPLTRAHYDDPRTGVVALYSVHGAKIVERRYRGAEGRATILQDFRKRFGAERFARLTVAIRPDVDADVLDLLEGDPLNERWWGVSRRGKKKAGGAKRDEGVEEVAANASQSNSFAPSFDDLGGAVGLAHSTQIDRILDQIEQVA
jgi:hypothetical protein